MHVNMLYVRICVLQSTLSDNVLVMPFARLNRNDPDPTDDAMIFPVDGIISPV